MAGTEGEPEPAKRPEHPWRGMILGTGGIVLLLALVGFAGLTVAGLKQAQAAIRKCHDPGDWQERGRVAIARLGGPEATARKLSLYLRLPGCPAAERAAAADLLSMCGSGSVPALLRLLGDPDGEVRERAAWALGQVPDRRAVEPLMAALADSGSHVRSLAAQALGAIGDPSAADALFAAISDQDDWVREHAALALGELGDRRAIEPLVAWLKGEPLREEYDRREGVARVLGGIDDCRVIEPLAAALDDRYWFVRLEAAKALARRKSPQAILPLARVAADPADVIRRVAVEALADCNEPQAVLALMSALYRDRDVQIRLMAARGLGNLRNRWAIEPLKTALKDRDDGVRRAAQEALAKIQAPAPAPPAGKQQ